MPPALAMVRTRQGHHLRRMRRCCVAVPCLGDLESPHLGDKSKDCRKTVEAPIGKVVAIEFVRLSVRNSYDCLEVHDTATLDTTDKTHMMAEFCGQRTIGTTPPALLRSEGRSVTFRWDNLPTGYSKGFELRWRFVAPPASPASVCGPGGALVSATGTLSDRVATSSRTLAAEGARCSRIIKGPPGTVVRVQFNYLKMPTTSSLKFSRVSAAAGDRYHPLMTAPT